MSMKKPRPYINPFDEQPPDKGEAVALLAFILCILGLTLWAFVKGPTP